MKTYAKKSRWWLMLPVVALASVVVASCYTFTLIEMPHELIAGETFSGKVVVKRNGKQDNGLVQHVYGLYGICLPDNAVYVVFFSMSCMLSLATEKSTQIDTVDARNWLSFQ